MTSIRRNLGVAMALGPVLALAGCTLGPDPGTPPATAADHAPSFVNAPAIDATPPDDWWRHFADPATVELVELALASNPDARAAAARVLEAQASLRSATGARLPEAGLSFSGNRSKSSFVLPQVGRVGIYSTTFSDQLQVSYQVDLFGRLARARQAAWAELMATEADRRAVLNSLIAEVIRTRVQIVSIEEQLGLAGATAASWRRTAAVVEERYRRGLADAGQLHQVRSSLARSEAALPQLRRSLASARHALDVLVGRRPGTGPELPHTLPPLPDLSPVPTGLPAALLDRRPDLVAARMRFSEATAGVGVALANLYPNLTLSAAGGYTGNHVADLTKSANQIYNAALALAAPLFEGGRLRAEVAAARARAEQAAAAYASAVLKALREVEDALVADVELEEELGTARRELRAARAAEELARRRYESGTGQLLDLLAAHRSRAAAEASLVSLRAGLWNGRIALFLALGGDWTAAPEAVSTPPSSPTTEVSP